MRRLLILVGLVGLVLVIVTSLGDFKEFRHLGSHLHWYVFVLVIAAQLMSYYCNAHFYRSFFHIFDYEVSWKKLFEVSLAINFANQVIPSGGVAGTTYLVGATQGEVPGGKATLAQLGRYVFSFLSFLLVLLMGFIVLFFGGSVGRISVRLILIAIMVALFVGLLGVFLLSDRALAARVVTMGLRLANRIKRLVRGRHARPWSREGIDHFLDELYEGYHELVGRKGRWVWPLIWALGGNIAEVLTVYVVFVAFGVWENLGVVIAGYTFATVISLVAVFAAGLVAYEAGMVGTYVALGVPFALSFSVSIIYRVLNMILFLPPGFYYYRKYLVRST